MGVYYLVDYVYGLMLCCGYVIHLLSAVEGYCEWCPLSCQVIVGHTLLICLFTGVWLYGWYAAFDEPVPTLLM